MDRLKSNRPLFPLRSLCRSVTLPKGPYSDHIPSGDLIINHLFSKPETRAHGARIDDNVIAECFCMSFVLGLKHESSKVDQDLTIRVTYSFYWYALAHFCISVRHGVRILFCGEALNAKALRV